MSSLTSLQVNQSYQGLIKLADSTSGVTSSLQSVQDGLGNDLPFKVSSGVFITNVSMSYPQYGVGSYFGTGFLGTAGASAAGQQNVLVAIPFYDRGELSYSAISYSLITATTTTDVVNVSFYSSQYIDGIGICPKDVIKSGLTWTTSTPGVKTDTIAGDLSFSGNGPGIYWAVFKIDNGNVTPSVRYATTSTYSDNLVSSIVESLGFVANSGGAYIAAWENNATSASATVVYNTTSYPNPFTAVDAGNTINLNVSRFGFVLHTRK
jgi:hypothetical protein